MGAEDGQYGVDRREDSYIAPFVDLRLAPLPQLSRVCERICLIVQGGGSNGRHYGAGSRADNLGALCSCPQNSASPFPDNGAPGKMSHQRLHRGVYETTCPRQTFAPCDALCHARRHAGRQSP